MLASDSIEACRRPLHGANSDDPTVGSNATYSSVFQGLSSTSFYELYLNLPVGPTDVGNGTSYVARQRGAHLASLLIIAYGIVGATQAKET